MNEILQIIIYLGSVQGLLLSVFLFSIRTNKISNRLLALLTLSWGIVLLTFALQEKGLYLRFPHLLMVIDQLLYLFFPLLYLQVKYLLARHTKFYLPDLLHFLPLLISVIFHIDFFLQSGEDKINLIRNTTEYFNILQIVGNEVIALQGVIYSIMAINLIRKYRKKIKDFESTLDKNIVKVLFLGISLNLFSWIIGITGIHLEYLKIELGVDLFALTYLVLVMVIYTISYVAVKSPEIFKLDIDQIRAEDSKTQFSGDNTRKKEEILQSELDQSNLQESKSTDPALNEINERLIQFMENEKPYLEPEISLPELAVQLDIPRNQLSGVINQIHNKNFYEFVNQYRIDEVKQLITDPKNSNYKLISLAYDAGFNSKASFNRIFKQITKMTPSQFLATQQNT